MACMTNTHTKPLNITINQYNVFSAVWLCFCKLHGMQNYSFSTSSLGTETDYTNNCKQKWTFYALAIEIQSKLVSNSIDKNKSITGSVT